MTEDMSTGRSAVRMAADLEVSGRFCRNLADPAAERRRALALDMMAQQAQRMQSVVQDLLTLSRLEGSPLPGMAEWTPVQSLMQRCEEGRALVIMSRTDIDGIIISVSSAFCRISGFESFELIGKTHNVLKNQDMPKKVFENL